MVAEFKFHLYSKDLGQFPIQSAQILTAFRLG